MKSWSPLEHFRKQLLVAIIVKGKITFSLCLSRHNYTVQNELLSVVACIQGQSLVKTGAGNSKMRLAAIKAFQMSAR